MSSQIWISKVGTVSWHNAWCVP